ncbi:hypothetical protein J6590_057772 [Homalodisca vitripennis]|nr:hypothetical protein J6590_057772 [Homalodisca vitripennis]
MPSLSLAVVVLAILGRSHSLSYHACDSAMGKVHSMYIPGCEVGDVCYISKGLTKPIHIRFTPNTKTQQVVTVVHVKVGWASIPVRLTHPTSCFLIPPLPLKRASPYEYVFNMSIENSAPSREEDKGRGCFVSTRYGDLNANLDAQRKDTNL